MLFNAVRENKILAKISGFTVEDEAHIMQLANYCPDV